MNFEALDYEEEFILEPPTIMETIEDCVIPSLSDITLKIFYLILSNFIFSFASPANMGLKAFHCTSSIIGITVMYLIVEAGILHFLLFLLVMYLIISTFYNYTLVTTSLQYVTGTVCVLHILLCEFFYPYQDEWSQSRGIFMIATMKIISMTSDIHLFQIQFKLSHYLGYMLYPANSIFGPWISFIEYTTAFARLRRGRNLKWWTYLVFTLIKSIGFLTLSNCWGTYLIPDSSSKWIVAYRKALSFRSSHYFISYLSEAAMVTSGFISEKSVAENRWGYEVTNFTRIEFPSSLVNVIIHWNIPMHRFLKRYIYYKTVTLGRFFGILSTFMVSSLLHGFNMELTAVLLTIGVYSYVQFRFQDTLSKQLNACLTVRECRSCSHKYRRNNILVALAQLMFTFLTVFNLIFLGILMDFSDPREGIYDKWEHLDFLPHWVMGFLFLYCFSTGN